MKKIWNKIRKVFASIGVALFTLGTKVMADIPIQESYNADMYGVEPPPTIGERILPVIKTIFIPSILIIGLFIYWRNSKAIKKYKIYFTVGMIALVALIYWKLNFIEV